jgi:TolB-like protein
VTGGATSIARRALLLCVCAFAGSGRLSFAQCPDGTPPPCGRAASRPAAAPAANSVAVLLFANLAHDTSFAYLSDGLASEIATTLARVPRLEVRSPGAVRSALRDREPDPQSAGRRLNVRYVVEGDFQRGADRIRISVRLVTVASGTQRWSESYTRPASDLLAVQEEIASAVVTAIAGQLLPQERSVLAARPTRSAEAYDHFLRGNFDLGQRTPVGVRSGIEEYRAALAVDPSFTGAEARIALAYALYLDWGWVYPDIPRDSLRVRGFRAADRALALDSATADGWMARGYLLILGNGPAGGAVEAMERATRLDPGNAEAWHQYGGVLMALGRYDESVAASRHALTLEPGRAITLFQLAAVYLTMRRDVEALRGFDSALVTDPTFATAYAYRSRTRLGLGDTVGARADAAAAARYGAAGEPYYGLVPRAVVASAAGDTATARDLMNRAIAAFGTRPVSPISSRTLAGGLVAVGRPAQALDYLERVEPRGHVFWFTLQDPLFDAVRADPRFQRLVDETRPQGAR